MCSPRRWTSRTHGCARSRHVRHPGPVARAPIVEIDGVDQDALLHQPDVVAVRHHPLEVVGREQHGRPLERSVAEDAVHQVQRQRVHAARRLVEHEHGRPGQERRRDAEALPHTERVDADRPIGRGRELHLFEDLVDAAAGDTAREARVEAEVAASGEVRVERRRHLDDGAEATSDAGPLVRVLAEHPHRPRGRERESRHQADDRGLPRPVRTHQGVHLAGPDLEGEATNDRTPAVPFGQPDGLDRWRHLRRSAIHAHLEDEPTRPAREPAMAWFTCPGRRPPNGRRPPRRCRTRSAPRSANLRPPWRRGRSRRRAPRPDRSRSCR